MLGVFKSYVGHINSTLEMSTAVHSQDELVCPNHLTDWLTEELCWLDATNGFQSIVGWWKLVSDAWRMWVWNFARKRIITTFKHWQAWRFVLHSHSTSWSWELPVQLIERLNLTSWTWPKSKVGRLKRLKRHFFFAKRPSYHQLHGCWQMRHFCPTVSHHWANWLPTQLWNGGQRPPSLATRPPFCKDQFVQKSVSRERFFAKNQMTNLVLYSMEGIIKKTKKWIRSCPLPDQPGPWSKVTWTSAEGVVC